MATREQLGTLARDDRWMNEDHRAACAGHSDGVRRVGRAAYFHSGAEA